jgi:hypothetical protein
LWGGVKGPCLYRPENWLVRQVIDKPKLVYEVGFIRAKGTLQVEQCSGAQKLVALFSGKGWGFYGCFNSGLGGLFSLAMNLWAFLGELVCFAPYWGKGNNLQRISCGRSFRPIISSSVCGNADLQLPLRMQE